MKKLIVKKKGPGRNRNEIPSVKRSLCFSGPQWDWVKKEAETRSKKSGCSISELQVVYSLVDLAMKKS